MNEQNSHSYARSRVDLLTNNCMNSLCSTMLSLLINMLIYKNITFPDYIKQYKLSVFWISFSQKIYFAFCQIQVQFSNILCRTDPTLFVNCCLIVQFSCLLVQLNFFFLLDETHLLKLPAVVCDSCGDAAS